MPVQHTLVLAVQVIYKTESLLHNSFVEGGISRHGFLHLLQKLSRHYISLFLSFLLLSYFSVVLWNRNRTCLCGSRLCGF